MQVSAFSIVFMAISAVISIGLPIFLFIFLYRKYSAKVIPMIVGACAFIIFAMILEQTVHSIVFRNFALWEKPLLYIIYGTFMAGIFEETARFFSFTILKRKYNGVITGLSYGIGHGGIEAVLLAGVSMISSIVLCIFFNAGNIEIITGSLQGEASEQINMQINALLTSAPYMFLLSGMERLFAISIQISLSVIVFYSVYCKGKIWLFPSAILLHAIIDIPAAAFQVNILKSIFVVETLAALAAVIVTILAAVLHRKLKEKL
ncbi:MAG: YhfC family intramembrane metalloprotease [Treponema sp.]|nr:YhfC family intramembrane metalloprotease [Treponema sp.]